MELPERIREQFRRHGRLGGRARAARTSPERRTAIARRAATARWIKERFGATSFEVVGLPGGEIVDAGLADLACGRVTRDSLLVSLAAPRLRREGVPVPPGSALEHPEERLYGLLEEGGGELAHARYNAHLRRMVSFADACRAARVDRG